MTVIIDKHRFIFVSAPKIACSSVKNALFELENGFAFRPFFANGKRRHIHDRLVYPAAAFNTINQARVADYTRVTLVRNPIRRFLSAYSNRVVHYKELSRQKVPNWPEDLPENPDLAQFIENLETYREIAPSIRLHTQPLAFFLGDDPKYYTRIFNMREIPALEDYLSRIFATPFKLPHLQTGGPKIDPDALSGDHVKKLGTFYRKDFRLYGEFFEA